MFKIFEKKYTESNSVIKPPEFELVRRVYTSQIDNIVSYYQENVKVVQNQHLLCRILNLFTPSTDYDLNTFIGIVYARAPYIAKHFKLTSEISYGELFTDVFYRGYQVIMYNEEYFNVHDAVKDWKNLRAIKVLKHPISNLTCLLPNPDRYPTREAGLSCVSINLPMLILQYREFLKNELLKPEGSLGGVQQFVARYALPNMLYSHIDVCLVNRFYNLCYDRPNVDSDISKHAIMIIDYSKRVDNVLRQLVKYLRNKTLPYSGYLKLIPAIYSEDGQETLIVPDHIKTRQNWWALYLSRLDTMKMLMELGGQMGVARNGELIARAKVDSKRLLQENIYGSQLPAAMSEQVVNRLKLLVG